MRKGSGASRDEFPGAPDRPFLLRTRASRLTRLFIICLSSEEALDVRDDVAFFDSVRGQVWIWRFARSSPKR